jgi:hypothetical protein
MREEETRPIAPQIQAHQNKRRLRCQGRMTSPLSSARQHVEEKRSFMVGIACILMIATAAHRVRLFTTTQYTK